MTKPDLINAVWECRAGVHPNSQTLGAGAHHERHPPVPSHAAYLDVGFAEMHENPGIAAYDVLEVQGLELPEDAV